LRERRQPELRRVQQHVAGLVAQLREQGRELGRLRAENRLLRRAQTTTAEGVAIFTASGRMCLWSDGMAGLTGWPAADVADAATMLRRLAPGEEEHAQLRQWWKAMTEATGVVEGTLQCRDRAGGTLDLTTRFEHVDGSLVLHLCDADSAGVSRASLREAEQRYQSLARRLGVGLYSIDDPDSGRFSSVNPELARMLGYGSVAAALGSDPRVHQVQVGDGLAPVEGLAERTVGAGTSIICYETQLRRVDGGPPFWAQVTITVTADADGHYGRQDGVVQDVSGRRLLITERARLARERERSEKYRAVGELAAGIAHNFNNILTGILGNASLARHDGREAALTRLDRIEGAVGRARSLTRDLLSFARGKEPVITPTLLSELAMDCAQLCMAGSNSRCHVSVSTEPEWHVAVDPSQLAQVIDNLLLNARDAMAEGGTIELKLSNVEVPPELAAELPPGRYVQLTVADTGTGIDPAHAGRVFDADYTTKSTGTGLGLATSQTIVHRHGGSIGLESTPGVGSTFRVRLPVAQGEKSAPAASADVPTSCPPRRVLVMDDQLAVCETADEILSAFDHDVVTVTDGSAAVGAWREAMATDTPFDVAIMDLMVPGGMGGEQATAAILDLDPSARIIVSSGYSDSTAASDWRACGFVGSLPKPYGVRQILDAVEQATVEPVSESGETVAERDLED